MTSTDPTTEAPAVAPERVKGPAEMPRFRVRVRFSKTGPLRFISHNDLMRLWDRMLRRAGLPVKRTEGFHAKTKLSSPLSLAVGIEALDEIIDLEFTHECDPDEVGGLLRREAPPGLGIVSTSKLTTADARLQVTQVEYGCEFFSSVDSSLEERLSALMASSSWVVVRRVPGKPDRRIDIRPMIHHIAATPTSVVMLLRVDAGTTARPEEVLEALGQGGRQRDGDCLVTRRRVLVGPRIERAELSAAHGSEAVRTESGMNEKDHVD